MQPLRIAFRGNFRHPWCTEVHVSAEMESLGHTIVRVQEDEVPWAAVPAIAGDCDLFWWTCTWHEDIEGGFKALDALRAQGIRSVAHHLDLYLGLDRAALVPIDPFWKGVDAVFTADGDPAHQAEFERMGINHHWIRPGVFGPECVPGKRRREYASDVGFVGSWHGRYHSEWGYRTELVQWLRRTYRGRCGLWPKKGAVRGQDLNDLYASIKVVVGDSCNPNGITHYWSDRLYETMGRGGFLIFPHIEGIEDEGLVDGEHLRFYEYGDFRALRQLIDHYVSHTEERERIRKQGQEFVAAHCTYKHRLEEIFAIIEAEGLVDPEQRRKQSWPAVFRDGSADSQVHEEVYLTDVYRASERVHGGDLVLDLGANVGFFSVWAAQRGAQVVAVEPFLPNVIALRGHLDVAGLTKRVTVVPKAVGPESGGSVVCRKGKTDAEVWTEPAHPGTQRPVPTVSLEELLGSHERVAFLKVDIEGAEYQVFENVSNASLAKVAAIAVEFHGPAQIDGRYREGDLGRLVERLAETHHVEVFGRPSVGGYVHARRYGE